MNSQNRFILIMAGVCIPLLVGLRLYHNHDAIDKATLKTSMDVEAVNEVDAEPTGGQTVDTTSESSGTPHKADSEESIKRKQVISLVEEG